MSLLTHNTFNENDLNNARDYSTLGNDSISVTSVSITPAEIGDAFRFNGSSSKVTFGDIINVGGTDNISLFIKVQLTSSKLHSLAFKEDQWEIGVDANDKVFFRIIIGAVTKEVISTSPVTISGDYVTIACTYDGSAGSDQGKIYIDSVLDATTMTQTGNLDASTRDVILGSNNTDFLQGRIEMFSAYSQTLTQTEVTALHNKPGGFIIDFPDTSDFELGDMLQVNIKGLIAGSQSVVTGDLGSNQLLILPIANDIIRSGDVIRFAGNVFDTDRQCVLEQVLDSSGKPRLNLKNGVDNFSKADPSTDQRGGYKYTVDGLLWNTLIARNAMITPATLTSDQDDWNPIDETDSKLVLSTCNSINLSVSNPSIDITGIVAPSPAVPQEIVLTNVGSSNTSLKNNDAGSVPANRFLHSGNVSLSSEDAVTIKYDVDNARWRVISIT